MNRTIEKTEAELMMRFTEASRAISFWLGQQNEAIAALDQLRAPAPDGPDGSRVRTRLPRPRSAGQGRSIPETRANSPQKAVQGFRHQTGGTRLDSPDSFHGA